MLTYFLQVSLCWLVFYGLYYSLLSRETFFRLNRIYLIISLLCGLMAPFGQVFIEVKTTSPTVVMLEPFVVTAKAFQHKLTANTEGVMSLQFFIQLIYWLGVAVMSLRFLSGLFKIFRLYKHSQKVHHEAFIIVNTQRVHLPFSFFHYIFINPNVLETADIQQIIQHEKAHVKQRHSLDVVFVEILNILFWCNPIIYFYRHSLRNIHEYLADAAVLRSVSTPQYGRLLIKQSQSGPALALANHFIFSQLKKRIIMMTRNRSQRASLLKYVIAAPLFTVLLTLFAMPNNEVMAKTKDLSTKMDETVKAIDKEIKQKTNAQIVENKAVKPVLIQNTPVAVIALQSNYAPDPIPVLGDGQRGSIITAEEFKRQTKMICIEGLNGKESAIRITSFVMVHISRNEDPRQVAHTGGVFNKDALRLTQYAKVGDQYSFMSIKATDGVKEQDMGSMTFFIKDNSKGSGSLYDVPPSIKSVEPINSTMPQERVSPIMIVEQDTSKSDIMTKVDDLPEFKGGQTELFKWLGNNIKYPENAVKNKTEGTVYVGFVVEKDGSISNVSVKRGVPIVTVDTIVQINPTTYAQTVKLVKSELSDINDEAKRVIKAMPKWKPGKNKGKLVRVAYTLPIKFKLE